MSSTGPFHVFFAGNSATILYHVEELSVVVPGWFVNGPGLVDAVVLTNNTSVPNENTITLDGGAEFQEGDYMFSSYGIPSQLNIAIRPRAMDGAIQFWWTPSPPEENIIAYEIYVSDPNTYLYIPDNPSLSSAIMTGRTNGVSQSSFVRAYNAAGAGPVSYFRTVQPGLRPDPPQSVGHTQTGADATVTWTAPVSDGGSVIRYYFVKGVSSNPGDPDISGSVYGTELQRGFGGLNPASTYTFTVTAINDVQHSLPGGE
jgi:hypothetical protein